MNKKWNMILLVILAASLMMSTASASNRDDHAAGIGQMAHPTSSNGMEVCKGCHGDLGSSTTSGFCTKCHLFPIFASAATATTTGTATLTATPQLTPKETKEIMDEEETQKETESQKEIENTAQTPEPTVTTVAADKTPTTPGFGIIVALVGLFALALMIKAE